MSKSSQLTSVFWFAYGASRIVGIVGAKYLIPRTYILLAMTGKLLLLNSPDTICKIGQVFDRSVTDNSQKYKF